MKYLRRFRSSEQLNNVVVDTPFVGYVDHVSKLVFAPQSMGDRVAISLQGDQIDIQQLMWSDSSVWNDQAPWI